MAESEELKNPPKRRITPISHRKLSQPYSDFIASDSNESSPHLPDKVSQSTWDLNTLDKKQRKKKQKLRLKDGMADIVQMASVAMEDEDRNNNERYVDDKPRPERPPPPVPRHGKTFISYTFDNMTVKKLYQSMFGSDTFFDIIGTKQYDGFKNFKLSSWEINNDGKYQRLMTYEFNKTIAFSRNTISTRQIQTLTKYNESVFGIDTQTISTGVMYSDYFRLDIHYRLTGLSENTSKLDVIVKIEFIKPCLFKSRIESEAMSGLKKYYDCVLEELKPESPPLINGLKSNSPVKQKLELARRKSKISNLDDRLFSISGNSPDTKECRIGSDSPLHYGVLIVIICMLFILTIAMYKLFYIIENLALKLEDLESRLIENYEK